MPVPHSENRLRSPHWFGCRHARLVSMPGPILITGGSGFVGSRLLALAATNGRRVICLSRSQPSPVPGKFEFHPADLSDGDACGRAMAGCETVIHLAAATGKRAPAEYFRVNRDGTETMVREAQKAGVRRFLFVSTIAVRFADASRYYYAQSKRQAESVVRESSLAWTIVRPTIVLGPHAPVLEGLRKIAGLPVMPVFGSGRAPVQPVLVDDLARMLSDIAGQPGLNSRTIEIGGPEVLSIEQLMLRIRRKLGIRNQARIHLPVNLVGACLGLLEPVLRSLLPVTAGQLASFTNDGTAAPDLSPPGATAGMRGVDHMLESLA
jgi:nucleoside-diphosphate-sugar epimerase